MCLHDDTVFLAALDSLSTLSSTVKQCPITLMGFPSLSSTGGVGEFGNTPPPPERGGQSYLGAHEWSPQVKLC